MRAVLMLGMMVLLYACSPVSPSRLTKTFRSTEEQFQDHTGFVLYDPATKKTLYDFNGSSYFTPASNTKILTFYTALNVLADSVPALEFVQRGDSLIFWGTGDPSFLNKEVFYDSAAYQFLSNAEGDLYFSRANYDANHFGDGWAWDDYNSSYSPERSAFPLYGNVVSVIADHEVLRITPQWFAPFFSSGKPQKKTRVVRDLHRNRFVVHDSNQPVEVDEFNIPFQADSLTWISLLADTLKRPVYYAANKKPAFTLPLFATRYPLRQWLLLNVPVLPKM